MIRKLLATTALAALGASGAYAQDTTTPAPATPPATENAAPAAPAAPVVQADGSLVSNIVGESVYNGPGDDAESIGKVSDVVFDKDGQAKQLVIGVGGFLGIGTKNVAFDYDKLKWAEKNGDRWLVAETSKEALTALPDFDEAPYQPTPPPAPAGGDTSMAPGGAAAPGVGGAPADTAQAPVPETPAEPADMAQGMLASDVLGESVYNGPGADAENIGSVNDMVLNKEGKAEQYVIGVGGFLGVGQKNVAFDFGKASWVEKNGDRWMVVEATKEQLQGLPDFDRKAYDPAPATTAADAEAPATVTPAVDAAGKAPADDAAPAEDTAQAPAAETPAAEQTDDTAQAPAATDADDTAQAPAASDSGDTDATQTAAIDKSTLTEVPADKISADTLIGTTVYGADDAMVGEIGDVVLSADNGIDAVVVDVGGFLGVGEKPVAVGMDKLKFMADKDGNQYLYTNFTKEQLEAQTAYDKGSYAEKRDEQRMMVQ